MKQRFDFKQEPLEAYADFAEGNELFPETAVEGESPYEPTSDFEWTEEELDYSIIVSPTSPGDDRFRIPARSRRPSSLHFPFHTICFIERDRGTGFRPGGTGTLIAPQVVLTAKHVLMGVHPPCSVSRAFDARAWIPKVRVTPGADLSTANPRHQGPATPPSIVANSSRFRAHPELDFGVIILPQPFTKPKQFMMLQPRSTPRTATLLTIAGYPCDKPRGTMWGHSGRIPLTGVSNTHLRYTIDTCPGHSGSPIWLLGNAGVRLLLGVHTSGPAGCDNDPRPGRQCRPTGAPVTPVAGSNCGVRITCDVINAISGWCREFSVRGPVIDQVVYRRRCTRR